jgi:hypothetical protein
VFFANTEVMLIPVSKYSGVRSWKEIINADVHKGVCRQVVEFTSQRGRVGEEYPAGRMAVFGKNFFVAIRVRD